MDDDVKTWSMMREEKVDLDGGRKGFLYLCILTHNETPYKTAVYFV